MELICGACQGRLLVESPGTTVACPHCGTYLQTPAQPVAAAPFFPGFEDGPASGPDPGEDTVRLNPWEVPGGTSRVAPPPESFLKKTAPASMTGAPSESPSASSSVDLDAGPVEAAPVIRVSEAGSIVVSTAAAPAAEKTEKPQESPAELSFDDDGGAAAPARAAPAHTAPGAPVAAPDVAGATEAAESPASAVQIVSTEGASAAGAVPRGVEPAMAGAGSSADGQVVLSGSSFAFKLLVSYASAMTLLCAYLVMTRPSTLDLPDLSPPSKSKKVTTLIYLHPDKELPPANVMRLGESRQFGSVRVTPVRVTRGPVEFLFYKPGEDEKRAPEGPVLKLHLRFDNVSRDQEFMPLDRQLVFTKEPDRKEYGLFKTNNFVCNADDRTRLAKHVYIFDMSPNSEWLLRDQNLDHELKPGEYVETFIATTADDIESLAGDLVWRVHFRKGYNPQSFRGVTTLIEVLFRSSDIIDEAPAPAGPVGKDA